MSDQFDYGTSEELGGGGSFKNPEVGPHSARIKSIIHCGLFREEFQGEVKAPAPQVVVVYELKNEEDLEEGIEGDFEDDGVTPLYIHQTFPLKKGDRASMTKFIKTLDPKGEAAGFDDFIGKACTVTCKGGKDLGDDGKPKYINFGGIAGLAAKFAKTVPELVAPGVGHVRFEDLTKEAIMELNPYREVAGILMKGEKYEGSVAQSVIDEIRKDNPDFAKAKKKDAKETPKEEGAKEEVETNLAEEEEF